MNELRRPLFLVFIGMMVFICIWYHFTGEGGCSPAENQPVKCAGTVDEIQRTKNGNTLVLSDVSILNTNSKETVSCKKILLYDGSEQNLFKNSRQGNVIICTGMYSSFERAGNPGQFDAFLYYESKRIGGRIFVDSFAVQDSRYDHVRYALFRLRETAIKKLFSVMQEEDAGIMSAIILGDKAYLPEETKELYQNMGIGHILAISGLHISLLGAGLFFFLRSYVLPMKKSVLVTIGFLLVYGEFTGFPVATVRAVVMMICALTARYIGKSKDSLSAMSLSGIITLAWEPLQLFQSGFIFSYTAVAGIILFQLVEEKMEIKKALAKSLFSSVSLSLTTLPVMLWFFYEISPYTAALNLIVLPLLSLVVGIGAAGCVLAFLWPGAAEFLMAAVHYILRFYELLCRFFEQLPGSRCVVGRPEFPLILLYYGILLAAVCLYLRGRDKKVLCGGAVLLAAVSFFFRPVLEFSYIQLDVGQGDCACVMAGKRTYLIDGGSSSEKEIGKYTIQNLLKYYGRDGVDAIFITHSDEDHTSAVRELIAHQSQWNLTVGAVIMPDIQKKDKAYEALVKEFSNQGTEIIKMKKGDLLQENGLVMRCLHPARDYEWENENDYSLTLDISYGTIRILTTGDLEKQGESVLKLPKKAYDILKVGHHGSKTSTAQEFLDRVSPKHAIISAGRANRYGHPAPETLEKLETAGAKIWRTEENGAVIAEVKRGRMTMWQMTVPRSNDSFLSNPISLHNVKHQMSLIQSANMPYVLSPMQQFDQHSGRKRRYLCRLLPFRASCLW